MNLPGDLERLERRIAALEEAYGTIIRDAVDNVRGMREEFDRLALQVERQIHELDRLIHDDEKG